MPFLKDIRYLQTLILCGFRKGGENLNNVN